MCNIRDSIKTLIENNFLEIKRVYPFLISIKKLSIYGKNEKCKRVFCELHFSDETKKHTQVARVLLESSLGRVLDRKETVDHIDGDTLNNSLDNLQMLSLSDNAKKGPREDVKRMCIKNISEKNSGTHKGFGSKLSLNDVMEIRKSTLSNRELGRQYSVDHALISRIRNNVVWKNL